MNVEQLTYTIRGLSPLLMNNPRGMLAQGTSAPARQKKVPTPEEEAEGGTYRTAEGILAVPAIAVRNAMITAAAGFKYKTRSWKGFVSHVEIRPAELLPLYDPQGEPVTDYEIDLRRCVIKGRGAVARARPLVRDWQASFTFVADTSMLPTDEPPRAAQDLPRRGGRPRRHRRLPAGEDRLVRTLHSSGMTLSIPAASHGAASHARAWLGRARQRKARIYLSQGVSD